jgi:hypothetical protein
MNKTEVKALVAQYQAARNERLKLDNDSKKLKVKEDSILDQLIAAKVVSGQYGPYLVEAQFKDVARVTDWSTFHAYILESGSIDMLERRPTQSAVNARFDEGEVVPGVVRDRKHSYKISAA